MRRHRTIAGPPVRTSSQAWSTATGVIAVTLDADGDASSTVADALAPLASYGPALVAAGHLREPMILRGGALDLAITVATGETALSAEENLNPVPGGRSAGGEWVLHLPATGALSAGLRAATTTSPHLSCDPPSSSTPQPAESRRGATGSLVDLSALDSLRDP